MQIGFLISGLGSSQLAYSLLREAHHFYEGDSPTVDILAFYQNISKPWVTPPFAIMNISEAFSFHGVAIATDLNTAAKLRDFPGPERRYFYMWDVEWALGRDLPYEDMAGIYCDDSLPLIVRSGSHARLVEQCWGRSPCAVVPGFCMPTLIGVVGGS